MSKWITDRLPTEDDADRYGHVWITELRGGFVSWLRFSHVNLNKHAWKPIKFINLGWITDREPVRCDCDDAPDEKVWTVGNEIYLTYYTHIRKGQPWQPIVRPEPYVKPKRYELVWRSTTRQYYILDTASCDKCFVASRIPTRDAAVRILKIFEEET